MPPLRAAATLELFDPFRLCMHYICYTPVNQGSVLLKDCSLQAVSCILVFMYAAVDIGGTKTLVAVFDQRQKYRRTAQIPNES